MYDIKCVLFDIGGVLVDWHMSWITSEVSARFQIDETLLSDAFSRYLHELDSGKIKEQMFWQNIAADVNSQSLKENAESLWNTYFRKHAKPNSNVINLASNLKNCCTLGIISNIDQITHQIVDEWNVLENFDYKFMSYQIGFSKPDPRIYQHIMKVLPFKSENTLFIDDKKPNVDAAITEGINGIHYTSFPELTQLLSKYGL